MGTLYNQVLSELAQPQIQLTNVVKNLYFETAQDGRFRNGAIVGTAEKDGQFIGKRGWA